MDMNFIFSWSTRYLTRSLRSLVRYRVDHSKIKFISTRGHVISSISNPFISTVENVIILICDNDSLPPKDEEIASQSVKDIITRKGKGYIAWLKKGKLSVERDFLVNCLTSTSPTPQPNPQTNSWRASQEKNRDAPGSVADLFSTNSGQSKVVDFKEIPQTGHIFNTIQRQLSH